jgi:rhodanese-related sulfurtransferase
MLQFTFSHSPAFLAITNDAKTRTKEVSIADAKQRLTNKAVALLDVREESEWNAGHIKGSVHLGKGVLERDIETKFPDKNQELIMYCGGGFRSALTCDAAQKMGYTNVWSLAGGYKALVQAGWDVTK